SRALEDFSVAGWRGALNNIPTTMYAIGQAAGWSLDKVSKVTAAVSIFATVGVTVYQNWSFVKDLFRDFRDGGQKSIDVLGALGREWHSWIDRTRDNRAADDVVVLSGRLKEAKDKVEEMSQRARLTSDEMAEL